VALIPTFAMTTDTDGVVVNLFDAGTAKLKLRDGTAVDLTIETRYPSEERVLITVNLAERKTFGVKVRVPEWCAESTMEVHGLEPGKRDMKRETSGYWTVTREWEKGDRVELRFQLEPRVVVGDHTNQGKVAVLYGPLVLAADEALLGATNRSLKAISAAGTNLAALAVMPEPAPDGFKSWPGAQVFRVNALARKSTGSLKAGVPLRVRLVPFADAGANGTAYKLWLPLGLASSSDNVLFDGQESRSRAGNVMGSITDDDLLSFVVTFDDKPRMEDWFAVTLDEPVAVSRVVFAHGQTFHDGGWFDASAGKPRIEVKASADAPWRTLAALGNYPATTAADAAGLKGGECFACELASPIKVWAIRVVGKPACGDNPKQAFTSCAELQAFGAQPDAGHKSKTQGSRL
jgi:hypothetical protein